MAPESYWIDYALLWRPGNDEIQFDPFGDYRDNVALYPAFHAYFIEHGPPVLTVWGKHDTFFLPPGSEAFRRDSLNAEVTLLDTGHVALETHAAGIAARIRGVLG